MWPLLSIPMDMGGIYTGSNAAGVAGERERGIMDAKPFGGHLLDLLARRGVSQRRFAQSIDMDPTYLNRIIKGTVQRPDPETIAKMATALDMPYAELAVMAGYPQDGVGQEPAPPMLVAVPRDSDRLSVAEMVAAVEAHPGEEFQRRLRAKHNSLPRPNYVSFCVDLFRMWEGNAIMAFNLRDDGEGPAGLAQK